ncbi:MAG: hypothetical protein R8M38_05975 [Mariprofundaceae bacterium]
MAQFYRLNAEGVIAMQRERWRYAERAYARALIAAQLADQPTLQAKVMYNLGMVRLSLEKEVEAEAMFIKAQRVAVQFSEKDTAMRSRLALALMYARLGRSVKPFDAWPQAGFPTDIYLSAARLAQYQQEPLVAERAYQRVITMRAESSLAIRYRAQSYLGLALLSRDQLEPAKAKKYAHKALIACRMIGLPRISAHALMLLANLEENLNEQQSFLVRSLVIYQALKDKAGQIKALIKLVNVTEKLKRSALASQYRSQLDALAGSPTKED